MKQGYLQIKIRELNEQVESLNNKLEDCQQEVSQTEKRVNQICFDSLKKLQPILTLNDYVNEMNGLIHKLIGDALEENLKHFKSFIETKLSETCKAHSEHHKQDLKAGIDYLDKEFDKKFGNVVNLLRGGQK